MKFLIPLLCLCSVAFADLQRHTQKLTPQISEHLVMIGRLGLIDTCPGVVITQEGHILAPKIFSVDATETPYLLYHPDGSREILETLEEPERRPVVLLKLPEGITIKPAAIAPPQALKNSRWFYLPTLSPFPALNEPASILLDSRYQSEESKKRKDPNIFELSQPSLKPGTPVFDLNGRLLAISLPPRRSDQGKFTRALLLSRLAEGMDELAEILPSSNASPLFNQPNFKTTTAHSPSVGVILNEDKPATYSVAGIIVRSDGLILTKASELGPKLIFHHQKKKYPAVILATDPATDLALVGIEAQNLPVIEWADSSSLKPGALLQHTSLLSQISPDMKEMEETSLATFSHRLPAHPTSIHHSSRVTSLGIVPEQTENRLTISAIRPGSPAEKSDLRLGDQLLQLDGKDLTNRVTLTKLLSMKEVGDKVSLAIKRDGKPLTISLALSAASLAPETTGIRIDEPQACVPSVVRGPFPETLVHTLPLSAWDCGSPLLDLNHRAYGINIAAITSTRALALPVTVIKAALTRMMTSQNF